MRALVTLNDIFLRIAVETGPRAILYLDKQGEWRALSGAELYLRARSLASELAAWGLVQGDRVAIVSENRWEWAITDFATLALGLVNVPIFPTLQPEVTGNLLAHSGARVAVVSTRQQYEKVAAARARTSIERIVVMDRVDGLDPQDAVWFGSLTGTADASQAELVRDADFDAGAAAVRPDDPATIIYTSGTTAEPKGVVLTHGNIAENVNYSLREFTFKPDDSSLSFLPLSHITARHLDYAMFVGKVAVAYVPSMDKLLPAIKAVHPTFFVAVPRVFEKIRQEIERRSAASGFKRRVVAWALATGARHRGAIERGERPSSLLWRLAEKLFYSKLRESFGGRVRYYIAGGAPLGMDTAVWFLNAGIRILEGYGLTETSPVLGVNTPLNYRLGSIGKILPNIEARIADDGELLVRGPNVFQQYWQNPEMTRAAFDDEGWFYTGDIGRIDDERYLYITDRKKELLKTSAGKLVAPQPIEGKLKADRFIAEAALVGDREKYVAALLAPNFAVLEPWAKEQGIVAGTRAELVAHPTVQARYRQTIKQVNRTLADYELLKRFTLVTDEWTLETGELTPSLKLKRRVLAERYREEIAALFRGGA